MSKSKYGIDDVKLWAEEYKKCGSFRQVAKVMGIDKSVIIRKLKKYKNDFNIEFKSETANRLATNELKECYSCKVIKNFIAFDKDAKSKSKLKWECKDCQAKRYKRAESNIKYSINDIEKWAQEYKKVLSFSGVAKKFNIPKTTIQRLLRKHKEELKIKFANEFRKELRAKNQYYCISCNNIKSIERFEFRSDTEKYRNKCFDCYNKEFKFKYHNDESFRDKILIISKNVDKDKKRKYNKNWYEKNPEKVKIWAKNNPEKAKAVHKKWRIKNKDRIKQNLQIWRSNNRDKEKSYKMKRRALKLNIHEDYSTLDMDITFKMFNHCCFKCKDTNHLTIDHHYPLSKGYALSLTNAVVLCRSCNSTKHNKLPKDFYSDVELNQIDQIFTTIRSLQGAK